MKSTKIVTPIQPNISAKCNGIRYFFETSDTELPVDVADYFIKRGIVNSTGKINKNINYDLNGDGKYDKKDKSIAGKILATKIKEEK